MSILIFSLCRPIAPNHPSAAPPRHPACIPSFTQNPHPSFALIHPHKQVSFGIKGEMEVRLFKEFVKKIITIKRSQGQQAAEDWLAEKGRQEILAKLHPDNPDQHLRACNAFFNEATRWLKNKSPQKSRPWKTARLYTDKVCFPLRNDHDGTIMDDDGSDDEETVVKVTRKGKMIWHGNGDRVMRKAEIDLMNKRIKRAQEKNNDTVDFKPVTQRTPEHQRQRLYDGLLRVLLPQVSSGNLHTAIAVYLHGHFPNAKISEISESVTGRSAFDDHERELHDTATVHMLHTLRDVPFLHVATDRGNHKGQWFVRCVRCVKG